jgi:hypothetical protein
MLTAACGKAFNLADTNDWANGDVALGVAVTPVVTGVLVGALWLVS